MAVRPAAVHLEGGAVPAHTMPAVVNPVRAQPRRAPKEPNHHDHNHNPTVVTTQVAKSVSADTASPWE
jgi:hypothetical protein